MKLKSTRRKELPGGAVIVLSLHQQRDIQGRNDSRKGHGRACYVGMPVGSFLPKGLGMGFGKSTVAAPPSVWNQLDSSRRLKERASTHLGKLYSRLPRFICLLDTGDRAT
jgi:hypothetical protein